jgi:hypothetical protein
MKFNQESFNRNDAKGKELLKAFLVSNGHNILENCDVYGIDFFSEKDDKKYFWEVEMKSKRPWTCKEDFPFDSVSFLSRKAKWKDNSFWYVIICSETQAAIFCKSDVIFNEGFKETIRIYTQERKGVDKFFRVPKDLCIFVTSKDFAI